MTTPLVEMFKHNLWANLQVLDACSKLNPQQLNTVIPGTYGSIRDTLLHIFGAEERYVARLREEPRPASREKGEFPGFDELRAAATASGEALIQLAEQGAPVEVLRGTQGDGRPFEIASNIMFTQAINHATEHRAHINSVLTHLGVQPCDVDGWAYGDATGLVREG
jgi:uncharacterized damage-inducible protein DinB